ncbi:MAG: ABC transporter ATP-binding protein [Methanoregula sp.]
MPGIIEADDLTKTYNDMVAVSHIKFSVEKGEIFGFLGPNGAGKTTTMRMIECISPRTSGTLRVFGMDPDRNPAEIKQRIGVVPQESNLDPDFTCAGNLRTYARYFDIPAAESEKQVENLLAFVALTEKRDVSIDKLSGGMKRRLILARALINNPDLLILDEPTIGLDPQARLLIWERLRLLQAQGHTIVLTTHYLDEAARLCDRLVIMDNGMILVEGKPQDLIRDQVGTEIVEMDNTPDVIACLSEMGIPYESVGDQLQVATDTSRELAKTLLDRCKTSRVNTRLATLEDVFLKLTGRNLRE